MLLLQILNSSHPSPLCVQPGVKFEFDEDQKLKQNFKYNGNPIHNLPLNPREVDKSMNISRTSFQ